MSNIKPVWKIGNNPDKKKKYKPNKKKRKRKTAKQLKSETKSKWFGSLGPEEQEAHRAKNKIKSLKKQIKIAKRMERERLRKLDIEQQWENLFR